MGKDSDILQVVKDQDVESLHRMLVKNRTSKSSEYGANASAGCCGVCTRGHNVLWVGRSGGNPQTLRGSLPQGSCDILTIAQEFPPSGGSEVEVKAVVCGMPSLLSVAEGCKAGVHEV